MACESQHQPSCHSAKHKMDYLLWFSLGGVFLCYVVAWQFFEVFAGVMWFSTLTASVFELINTMWWGVAIGIVMLALLSKVPREFVMALLGHKEGFGSVARAACAGVLLDLCSHGILMVAMKLYERGASLGQVMAFLVASPWNSFSLTLILFALIGVSWTLAFIALSLAIALTTGVVFDSLVKKGVLPANPHKIDLPDDFQFWPNAKRGIASTSYDAVLFKEMAVSGILESRMVLRWLLFGVLLAGCIRAFVPVEMFGDYFGSTVLGLGLTVLMATIIEVCSEGSAPIAADIFNRAGSPGNSFAFLMAGVSTDYTEVMVLKDQTKSWKIALFLPLVTLPQVVIIAALINFTTV